MNSENGQATIYLLVGLADLVILGGLTYISKGATLIPFAFGISYGFSNGIMGAIESYQKGENVYLGFSKNFSEGILYGETLGTIGGVSSNMATGVVGATTIEAGLETLLDSVVAMKDNVVLSFETIAVGFATNLGFNNIDVPFKKIDAWLKSIKPPKFVDDIVSWFKNLGKGGTGTVVEEGLEALSTPSSKVLRQNLIDAGVEVPDYPNAAHHIVAGNSAKAEEARAILQKFGIDINDAVNGVFLPTVKDTVDSAYHPSLHTDQYYRKVTEMLSQAQSKDDVIDILSDIAEQLKNGTFEY